MKFNPPSCPHCEHSWLSHCLEAGCFDGWEWDECGVVSKVGCQCMIAHSDGPKSLDDAILNLERT